MHQLDLTEGVIWKTLLRYSTPIVLSSVLQSAYAITDLMVASFFIGKAGVSAINNAGQIVVILTQIIMGIATGGNILMGQFYGSKNHKGRHETNVTLLSLALAAGVCMAILVFLGGRSMLLALDAPALEEATAYIRICAFGLLPVFGYNACASMIRAVGNSKQPFYCVLVTVIVNVVLDILFIGAFQWGVQGAALATVIAQCISFLVSLVYVLKYRDLFQVSLRHLYIKLDKLKTMLRLGIPSAVQMTIVGMSWLLMTFLINQYGIEASAASGYCVKIKDFAQMFTIALSSAAATVVAQCLGAGKFQRASRVVHVAMRLAIGVAVLLIVGIELLAPQLIELFRPDETTASLAILNLRIEIISLVFYASFMVYNALPMGAGHTLFALGSSLLNCILVRVVLAVILDRSFGLVGVYWACMIAPISSVPLGYLYERSGVWRKSLDKGTEQTPQTATEER